MVSGAVYAAANAFNLICMIAGQFEGGVSVRPPNPEQLVLVVDLSAGRYCYDRCWETELISHVTDQEIFFISKTSEPASEVLSVNRESGNLTWHLGINEDERQWFGICNKAEFTGFPSKKF